MTFISYAQNFEDVLLWRALHDIEQGRYVDIGAHDPVVDSVSFAFYQAGWRGIHVEPVRAYAERLREARSDEVVIEAAVTDAPGPIEFFEIPGTGISTGRPDIAEHHTTLGFEPQQIFTPTVRLDDLFEIIEGDVHWLKIDVEGMEADVLRSWGANDRRPWLLVIEATYPNTQQLTQDIWIEEVRRRGYRQVFFVGLSCYFLHRDREELAGRFHAPPNVFDEFAVTNQHFSAKLLRDQLSAAETQLDVEQSRAIGLELERDRARTNLDQAQQDNRQVLERLAAAEESHRDTLERLTVATATVARLEERSTQLQAQLARVMEAAAQSRAREADRAAQSHVREMDLERQLAEAKSKQQYDFSRYQDKELRLDAEKKELVEQLARAEQRNVDFGAELNAIRSSLTVLALEVSKAAAKPPGVWKRLGRLLRVEKPSSQGQVLIERANSLGVAASPSSSTAALQPTEANQVMLSNAPVDARNPYLRANSLAELLDWDDVDFVRCAYVTILGRQPDKNGEQHFTRRLRLGDSKQTILWQLRRSEEGPGHDPGIAGLDRALKKEAMRRSWLFGWLIRRVMQGEGTSKQDRAFRQLQNRMAVIAEQQSRQAQATVSIQAQLGGVISRLESVVEGLPRVLDPIQAGEGQSVQQAPEQPKHSQPNVSVRTTDDLDLSSRERAVLNSIQLARY